TRESPTELWSNQAVGVLNDVRAHAANVADSARFVTLDEVQLQNYAQSLQLDKSAQAELDPSTHFVKHTEPDATLAYIVTLDAINFGSGYFPHLKRRHGMSGYFTVASSLKDRFEA